MKITKLVALFNKDKIMLGIAVAVVSVVISMYSSPTVTRFLLILGIGILVNITMALYASYKLYDQSALYKPRELLSDLRLKDGEIGILLHASFDPLSRELEKLLYPAQLKIYNLYGSRHEDEKSIKISNRVFPPHPRQVNVDPTDMKDPSSSVDYIFAITAAHEILSQEKRVRFFKEVKRILKDDGRLILVEQMRDLVNFTFFNIGAFHFVSLKSWEKAISEAGLRIVQREKITMWGTALHIEKGRAESMSRNKVPLVGQ